MSVRWITLSLNQGRFSLLHRFCAHTHEWTFNDWDICSTWQGNNQPTVYGYMRSVHHLSGLCTCVCSNMIDSMVTFAWSQQNVYSTHCGIKHGNVKCVATFHWPHPDEQWLRPGPLETMRGIWGGYTLYMISLLVHYLVNKCENDYQYL